MNWKKFWAIFGEIFFFIIANGATIAFLVMNIISYKYVEANTNNSIEISYWDMLSSKAVYDLVSQYFKWAPEYHFYNKLLVYVFMIGGAIISIKLPSLFWKWNKGIKPLSKIVADENEEIIQFKKLYAKSQSMVLSKKEMKLLEKWIKKYGMKHLEDNNVEGNTENEKPE